MAKFFGVKCEKCKTPILLQAADDLKDMAFYTLPLTPIRCSHCGYRKQYKLSEGCIFEAPAL